MSRVIIVGNGTSVLDHKNGNLIDGFDVVVRMNSFRTKGFEDYTGTKTNIWFTVNNAHKRDCFEEKYVHSWQFDPQKCKIYQSLKPAIKISREQVEATGLEYPSTGLIAIFLFIKKYGSVTITGFDWWERSDHHYGDNEKRGTLHDPIAERDIILRLQKEGKLFFLSLHE